MAITKKQKELDVIKWLKSEECGVDVCGTFDYCVKCDKTKENPCDKAFKAFNKKPVAKKAPAKKTAAKKEVACTKTKK
ncbi:MAG: hypothetical protein E7369_03840 [Clostridiales bacterium]|nr:hypothetical protein [Clostridiales bacterium]